MKRMGAVLTSVSMGIAPPLKVEAVVPAVRLQPGLASPRAPPSALALVCSGESDPCRAWRRPRMRCQVRQTLAMIAGGGWSSALMLDVAEGASKFFRNMYTAELRKRCGQRVAWFGMDLCFGAG